MRATLAILLILLALLFSVIVYPLILRAKFIFFPPPAPVVYTENFRNPDITKLPTPTPTLQPLPESYEIAQKSFVPQTFNNCGPATLSMILSHYNIQKSQIELGQEMRPYQNPQGNNDDKSIFAQEFVFYAQKNGLESMARPNGTLDLLKKLISSDIPVVVRTLLHPNEDIGHFRIVRGYDDVRQVIIQDDSYEGPNRILSYEMYSGMWQPFNYGYILVYSKDKEEIVQSILGEEKNERVAWENALKRGETELSQDPNSIYPQFNISVAQYYLGNYQASVQSYESVESRLPFRMLWYQIEPIQAYQKVGSNERVFQLTDRILNNHNRAFSELYQIRGEVYLSQGQKELAKNEFEKAVFYNKNSSQTKF